MLGAGRLAGEIPFHVTQELTLEPILGLTFEECKPNQSKPVSQDQKKNKIKGLKQDSFGF